MEEFKVRFKQLRLENNLTQKSVATELKVSEDCVYSWEKGRSEPSITDLINIANLFNVTIDYLVGRTEI